MRSRMIDGSCFRKNFGHVMGHPMGPGARRERLSTYMVSSLMLIMMASAYPRITQTHHAELTVWLPTGLRVTPPSTASRAELIAAVGVGAK